MAMNILDKGGKPNMLAEVLERRKNEGDYRFFARPVTAGGGRQLSRLGLLVHIGVALAVAAALLVVLMFPWTGRRRDTNLPAPAAAAPAAPEPAAGNSEPEAPEAHEPAAEEPDTLPEEGKPAEPRPAAPPGTGPGAAEEPAESSPAFIPVEDVFTPLPKMSRDILDLTMDDYRTVSNLDMARVANNIGEEANVIAHVYRFLRSHTPAELAAMADPTLTQRDMLRDPDTNRGKVITLRVELVRKYMTFNWPKNPSGVRSTTMLFCYSVTAEHGRSIFVVLVPKPLESLREGGLYELTGVFMKRYPYRVEPGSDEQGWRWQPLILTMDLTPCPPPEFLSRRVSVAIVVVGALLLIALLFLVRGETRESVEKRHGRMERQRQARERVKQRTGSARLTPPYVRRDDGEPPAGGSGGPGTPASPAGDG